ncbi:MAG: site-2 protease family protein [Candidatus Omnitrophota bacterium]
MGLISILFKEPVTFLMLAVPLIYSIIAHEVAHGAVAYLFGDDTAKRAGRLTLNPLAHLDPAGTLMLFFVGFGWAKPVPVNYSKLRNFRTGLVCVSLAGCLTNIIIATIALSIISSMNLVTGHPVTMVLLVLARINIILGAFNLIPIPPLDGSKVLMGFLPSRLQLEFAKYERFGFPVLIVLLFTGLLDPVIIFIQKLIFIFIGLFLGVS